MRSLSGLVAKVRLPFPFSHPNWPIDVPRPAPKSTLGANFDSAWGRRREVRAVRALITDYVTRPALRAVTSPEVTGLERIAHIKAPVIFAANHASHLDTPLLLASLPERFRHKTSIGAGADYFFDKRWKSYLWTFLLAAIPIERNRVSRKSSDLALAVLAEGWSLVLFPEGGRTPDGFNREFKGGVALLALQAGVPVIPVYIGGTFEVLGKGSDKLRPGPTAVNFGAPLMPEGREMRAFAKEIEGSVTQLGDEVHYDYWTALQRRSHGAETPAADDRRRTWIDYWQRPTVAGREEDRKKTWPRLPIINRPI
ncbi:MAG: lysophospholipid acyltransferase family protein [Actinomycetota bacterium]|nr:lysophospholipid acyltransferase family protein [Actinomycetota bacterium]